MDRAALTVDDLDTLPVGDGRAAEAPRELVAGVLRTVATPSAAGLRCVAELAAALRASARDHRVEVRAALVVGERDLLVPDLVLVRPTWPRAAGAHPGPDHGVAARGATRAARWAAAGVALAVFVGEDEAPLRWRAHRCARAGVREVWTIALGERQASRWRAPVDGRYARRDPLPPGEAVAPDALPDRRVVAWR